MKTEIEKYEIEAIADKIIEKIKPFIVGNDKREDDVIFSVEELSKYLKVSEKWIYERTHLKEIPHIKLYGKLRFRKKEIDEWLKTHNVPSVNISKRIIKTIK